MVHQTSNRLFQAVMNNIRFIVLDQPTWLRRNLEFWTNTGISAIQWLYLEGNALQTSYRVQYTQSVIMLFTHKLNTDQQAETVVRQRALSWTLCSTWYAMSARDVIIFSTISRMLCSVATVVIIILNVGWWSWARLWCIWKLPNPF